MSCSIALPRWGTMLRGELLERTIPKPLTSGTGYGFEQSWPTPVRDDTGIRKKKYAQGGTPLSMAATVWQTPVLDDAIDRVNGKMNSRGEPKLSAQVKLWPTPTVFGNHNRKGLSKSSGDGLSTAVKQWPTPAARDAKGANSREHCEIAGGGRKHMDQLANAVAHPDLKFPTPRAEDSQCAGGHRGKDDTLYGMVCRPKEGKNFPTPTKADATGGPGRSESRTGGDNLRTDIGGSLNPTWVEWLMGWPLGWTSMAPLSPETWAAWQRAFRIALEDSRQSGMDRCQPSQHSHGGCSND